MIYKERTDKTFRELHVTKENSLFLSHSTFCFNNGDVYAECSVTMKRWIVGEGFIGIVERAYNLANDIQIAPKGSFGFNDLDNYNLKLNGIIFSGMDEVEEFLRWFDTVVGIKK